MSENTPLTSSTNYGWTAGFTNMLRKELGRWWNWKSLATQLVVWMLLINGMVGLVVFVVPHVTDEGLRQQIAHELTQHGIVNGPVTFDFTSADISMMGMSMFFQISAIVMFIGAIILTHDSILKERETGTAAWLLSKPLSRKALVISKILANNISVMLIILAAQGVITYAICSVVLGRPVAVLPFLAGLGLLGLDVIFYIVMATALGTFFMSRGVALAVPIVFGLVGGELISLWPVLARYIPWEFGHFAQGLVTGAPLSSVDFMPVAATALWILLFIGATVWRFEKLEL